MALSQESRSIIELPTPIERSDRLPAGRVPLLAFVADRQTKTDVEESLAPLALADSPVMRGGIVKAIQFLASERSPETLIVDISGVEMPAARIQELAEVCEPGVTVIAIGDHNDIALYRDLMHAGVHDYIVKPVAPQALAEALDLRPGQAGAPISHRLAKLVALVGARGGVGTTTVAANLAWYLANRQNRRVALLDLQPAARRLRAGAQCDADRRVARGADKPGAARSRVSRTRHGRARRPPLCVERRGALRSRGEVHRRCGR